MHPARARRSRARWHVAQPSGRAARSARLLLAVALACTLPLEVWAQTRDTLSNDELAALGRATNAMRQWEDPAGPWPRVRIFRFIDATPDQSAAMLADYEHQRDYIADLKESTITGRPDPARTEVSFRYASNVPFVKDVRYTVLDLLRREADGSVVIGWHLIRGDKVKSVNGSARFTAWRNPGTGKVGTLLVYDQFVVPDFFGAKFGFVRARALAGMRAAVDAIAAEVERERDADSARLERQVTALHAGLRAQPNNGGSTDGRY